MISGEPRLGQGPYFQALSVGQTFKTFPRLITEADLVGFINVTGMLEVLFIAPEQAGGPIAGRLVPAALTYSLIEGFQMQTLLQGVGLALLEVSMKAEKPVRVGDVIEGVIEVIEIKPTSRNNRAVVTTEVKVQNQIGEVVLTYRVKRMLAGPPR